MPPLGVVLVHYHTPALLASAVAALRADAAGVRASGSRWWWSTTAAPPRKRTTLEAWSRCAGVRLFASGRNLGYAGGLNAGAALLPDAEILLLMNTDVLVGHGCLAALRARIAAGAAVVGPAPLVGRLGSRAGLRAAADRSRRSFGEELRRLAAAAPAADPSRGRGAARWRRHAEPVLRRRRPAAAATT